MFDVSGRPVPEDFVRAPKDCLDPHGLPLNPWRVRFFEQADGLWTAVYKRRNETTSVSNETSATRALLQLRHMIRATIVEVDGQFVEMRRP